MTNRLDYPRAYYASHREKQLAYHKERDLQFLYGITLEEYNEMLADQLWGCAICGKTNPHGKRLAVDHDHTSGKLRALLCARCNLVLGLIESSQIKRFEIYLQDFSKNNML